MSFVFKTVMCLGSDVPSDPASQNQILFAYEKWQELGEMTDGWQVKKTQPQLVKVLRTTDKAPEANMLILQNQALLCGLFKKD